MTRKMPKRDLYSILGIDADATSVQIRDAYVARARIMHPDRFDRVHQYEDWKKANEMLSELNEAYDILEDPETRSEYDRSRKIRFSLKEQNSESCNQTASSSPNTVDLNEFAPGSANFGDLPIYTQQRLVDRQNGRIPDQLRIKAKSITWNYLFMVILLCWFGYIFANVNGGKWTIMTLAVYSLNTVITGFLIGYNLTVIIQWITSTLKPSFYITPIYFIRTGYDTVTFTPIWSLKHISTNQDYRYGFYRISEILFKFEGYKDQIRLFSKNKIEEVFDRIRTYDARMRKQFTVSNYDYFHVHDDFPHVIRSNVAHAGNTHKNRQVIIYALSIVVCLGGLIAAVILNGNVSQKWFKHSSEAYPISNRSVQKPLAPEQPLPTTGIVHQRIAERRVAPFQITAAEGNHYLLKLVDLYDGEEALSIFVRGGSKIEIDVPVGLYEVRYASGKVWYGYNYLFGPETVYSKADKTFRFEISDNQTQGYSITLQQVFMEGNLREQHIKPEEF